MPGVQKMSLKQTGCFPSSLALFWLVVFTVEGKHPSLLPDEENKGISVKFTKIDDERIDSTEFPTGCSLRKLMKRSSSFDAAWLRGLESQENNCQIVPVTTAMQPVPTTRTTTKDPGKTTMHRIAAALPGKGPWLFHVFPYYLHNQYTAYNVLFPINRGASAYSTIWYDKYRRDDSSEEKRRKRDTLSIFHRKRARSP